MKILILSLFWFSSSAFADVTDAFINKIRPGHSFSASVDSPELSNSNWFSFGKKLKFSEIDKNEPYCLVQIKTSSGEAFPEKAMVKEGTELVIEEVNVARFDQYLEIKTQSVKGHKVLFYCLGKKITLSNGQESRIIFLKKDFLQIFDNIFKINFNAPIEI